MTPLEQAIESALNTGGESKDANKAYLEFIKANFIIPTQIHIGPVAEIAPKVLFLQEGEHVFLPVFTSMAHLSGWASEISDQINVLHLSGVDLLKGIGDEVTVCLNIGTPHYKEFNPSETARMRNIVLKFFKN
ncbi:MAG: Fe-S center protein [Coxiella sp. RIFCSPHIGHO2_12_FULL_44_14]|nr:MAG: Fe-S center protein [Coxiella sp. RIFCSPHIGHO2_12_FULL_44_14]